MSEASWEPKLARWSVGPGTTEEEKMNRAVTAIRKAIDADTKLSTLYIEVLPTGSYRNRTHIATESDVDVADTFHSNWYHIDPRASADETVRAALREAGVSPATYHYLEYKNDIERARVRRRRNRAIHLRRRSARQFHPHRSVPVPMDVPCSRR